MRRSTISRVRSVAAVCAVFGVLLCVIQGYRVGTAGGFAPTTMRPSCSEAAGGGFTRDYRSGESVRLERRYLPASAICRWSGGSTAALVPAGVLSWGGLVLLVGGLLAALVSLGIRPDGASRRRSRPPR